MYDAVTVDRERTSLELVADRAESYGFDGIVVRNADSVDALDGVDVGDSIDLVDGATVRSADPHRAGGAVGNARSEHTMVIVEGGSPSINRFAVETVAVDVLSRPMADDGDVNHVLVKAAVDNGVRIEFDLDGVLRRTGGRRVRTIQSLRKLHELVTYYDAPYVVSAGATSHLELRAPRELCAVADQLGISAAWLRDGLAEWGRLAARNRHVRSGSFIEPGVERGRYEADR
ncbi:RNase P subunit p30 family protein [Halovivax cerinus]|uniref:Ribonuclease P protein component 3 n=1 Tax=Halovivax cerinus TaxID=1487865 RepID=A0ABD5NN46_9EURY|nr:RNase P subunit p30 family protein [Halovivax cerinus]